MNRIYVIYAGLCALIGFSGCGPTASESERFFANYPVASTCEQVDNATLRLSGPIDDSMRGCALALLTADIKTVIVTSKGGEVFAGRAIGYKIGEQPRHLIVDKMCLSSCGNYFVPAAAKVTLRRGSVIGLHGTPDPHMLSNADMENHMASMIEDGSNASEGLTRILKRKSDRREKQLAEEAKFASHFNVPKGWRMYREAGDADDGWRRHFTAGSDRGVTPNKFMIVEETMMASCLPNIVTDNYQTTLQANVFEKPKLWETLKDKMGAYCSRELTCLKQPSGAHE